VKKTVVILALVALAATVFGVRAAADDNFRVGYVDVRKVVMESKKGQRNRAAFEKLVESKKVELEREQKKLKTLQGKIEKELLTMSEDQKQQKQREFQQKVQTYQRKASEAQKELGQKEAELTKSALQEIKAIISGIAKKENLSLVLEKNQQPMLYAQDGPDLTDQVKKKYDAKGK
jgi:outer membrane protein